MRPRERGTESERGREREREREEERKNKTYDKENIERERVLSDCFRE